MRRVVSNSQHMFSGELPIKLDDNDIELLMDNMRELSEDIESFKDTLHYS